MRNPQLSICHPLAVPKNSFNTYYEQNLLQRAETLSRVIDFDLLLATQTKLSL